MTSTRNDLLRLIERFGHRKENIHAVATKHCRGRLTASKHHGTTTRNTASESWRTHMPVQ